MVVCWCVAFINSINMYLKTHCSPLSLSPLLSGFFVIELNHIPFLTFHYIWDQDLGTRCMTHLYISTQLGILAKVLVWQPPKREFFLLFSYDQNQVFFSLLQYCCTRFTDDFLTFGFVKG